jgi:hypothetical protein
MEALKHLGANLYVNNNDVEAVDFLVDHHIMPKYVNKSFSVTTQEGMDLDMIVYNHKDENNRFLHIKLEDFASNGDSIFYLVNLFNHLSKEDYDTYKPAQKSMEEYLYMLPTYRALFGYNQTDN